VLFGGSFLKEKQQPEDTVAGLFGQHVTQLSDTPQVNHMLYQDGQLIGVLRDTSRLDRMLKDVYAERYEDDFPNSRLDLGSNVYLADEESYLVYEDADDEILNYIDENRLLAQAEDPDRTYIEEILPAKIALNMRYIKHQTLGEYMKIIFLTLAKIIR
jgi:hypothetical protein